MFTVQKKKHKAFSKIEVSLFYVRPFKVERSGNHFTTRDRERILLERDAGTQSKPSGRVPESGRKKQHRERKQAEKEPKDRMVMSRSNFNGRSEEEVQI